MPLSPCYIISIKIYLIRHGETTGDIEDRYGGWYDDHLTEKGRNQLAETAVKLKGLSIDMIFCSPLIRAQESVAIINDSEHVPIEIIDELKERNYGVLGGLTKAEAKEKYPEAVEAHQDPKNTDPEGEAQADFIARVKAAFADIRSKDHESVIVLAHGGSLKVILKKLDQPVPDKIGDGGIIEVTV